MTIHSQFLLNIHILQNVYKNEEICKNKSKQTAMFTFRNEHVYFRNRLGSIFMAVAQVALAEPERFPMWCVHSHRYRFINTCSFCIIVWRCSYYTEIDFTTDVIGYCTHFIGLGHCQCEHIVPQQSLLLLFQDNLILGYILNFPVHRLYRLIKYLYGAVFKLLHNL